MAVLGGCRAGLQGGAQPGSNWASWSTQRESSAPESSLLTGERACPPPLFSAEKIFPPFLWVALASCPAPVTRHRHRLRSLLQGPPYLQIIGNSYTPLP